MAATITGEVVGARTRNHGDQTTVTVYLEDQRLIELRLDDTVRNMLIGQLTQPA